MRARVRGDEGSSVEAREAGSSRSSGRWAGGAMYHMREREKGWANGREMGHR